MRWSFFWDTSEKLTNSCLYSQFPFPELFKSLFNFSQMIGHVLNFLFRNFFCVLSILLNPMKPSQISFPETFSNLFQFLSNDCSVSQSYFFWSSIPQFIRRVLILFSIHFYTRLTFSSYFNTHSMVLLYFTCISLTSFNF